MDEETTVKERVDTIAEDLGEQGFGQSQENKDFATRFLSNREEGGVKTDGTVSAPTIEANTRLNIPERPAPVVADDIIRGTAIPAEPTEAPVQDPTIQSDAESIRQELRGRQAILSELGLGDITSTFEDLLGKGAFTQSAEDAAGIDDKTVALNEIESQMRETDLRFRRDREAIQTEQGLTKAQVNARLNEVGRKQASELADLSVIQATRRDDLSTAQALVDRKVELKFEPIEQRLQFEQFLYNENKDLFSQVEQRQFEKKQQQEQIQIDKDKFKFQQLEQLKVNFLMNAAQSGQSNAYLQQIQAAETEDALLGIPNIQSFTLSQAEKLDQAIKGAQLDKLGRQAEAERQAIQAQANGIITKDQLKLATDLRKEVNNLAEVKNAKSMEADTQSLLSALDQETGVGDIAAINSFQRLAVDPGVAVREGDVALLQSAQSFGDKAFLKAQGLIRGDKLTDEARQQMRDVVEQVYEARVAFVEENIQPIKVTASQSGIDYNTYIGKDFADYREILSRARGGEGNMTVNPDGSITVQTTENVSDLDFWNN